MRGSLGAEVYAISMVVDHMSFWGDFSRPFRGLDPGMAGLEGRESLFTHPNKKKLVAEIYLVRYFPSTRQALEEGELDNAYWAPGTEKPEDGPTKVRRGMAPLLRLLESGHSNPGSLKSPAGIGLEGMGGPWRNYLLCGILHRAGASKLADGAWSRTTLNVGSLRRPEGILAARPRVWPWHKPGSVWERARVSVMRQGILRMTRQMMSCSRKVQINPCQLVRPYWY